MEIEEGEASYYQNGDKPMFDPDVSFSYIDERLQDILGHFQRDFEGGVSAENLGAKFGGYGSFLPTYARSPVCSQQRTTSEVIDGNTPKSPRILDLEANHLSSLASSCCSPPPLLEAGSTANQKGHGSISSRVKGDGRGVPFRSGETPTLKGKRRSKFRCDQRTLKVRLRVGSNNFPARKNSDIYTGLGLDGSPSPSLNDSYTDSEGLSHDSRDPSGNSPTSILKTMTSFLLQGAQLLSPLSEELICLTGKEKYLRESVSKPLHKGKVKGYESGKDVREPLPDKRTDSYENGDFIEAGDHINARHLLKRETGANDLSCEELITNALKLPLLSNKQPGPLCPSEGSVEASDHLRASNKGSLSMRSAEEQPSEHESVQEIERIQKSQVNIAPSINISIHEKENVVDNCTVTKKPSRHKGQRNIVSTKAESGLSEREKALSADLDSRETKIMQAAVSNNEVIGNQAQGEEQLCAMGGNKLEGGQTHDPLNNFASYKRNNGSRVNSLFSKNAFVDTSKDLKKITNKYQEYFGDLDFEQDENEVASKRVSSVKKLMDSKLEVNGSASEDVRITKEKSSVRKTGKPYKAEEYPRASNEKVPSIVTGSKFDAISRAPGPELEENGVLCDKCKKWRLLPLGRDSRSLPEKWMCSMLDWLPAMNHCSISEEETTDAVTALYQVSASLGTDCKLPGRPGNIRHNGQMLDRQTPHSGGEKTQKSKDDSSGPVCGESLQLSESLKNHQEKKKSLDCVNQSSLVDAYGNQYVGQCSSPIAEQPVKKPPKLISPENYSVGGDAKKSKTRKRRQSDSDTSRSSKKVKRHDVTHNDENGMSAPPMDLLESGNCLSNSSPNHMPQKDMHTTDGHPKYVKNEFPNHITATDITYDNSLPKHKRDYISSSRKEGQEEQGTHSYLGDLPLLGHQSRCNSEDNEKNIKKARTSNSEGQVAITRKSTCETGKKGRKSIEHQIGKLQGSSGIADSFKQDSGIVHASVASTSSSSKVSGSSKIKTSFQEVKGSPVESVSSSPLRVPSAVKCGSISRNPQAKDDRDGTFVDNCSPKGSLGGATNKVNHSTSVESSVVDLQDKNLGFVSGSQIKEENRCSSNFASEPLNDADSKGNHDTYKNQASERYEDERKDNRAFNGGSHSRKLENGMSLHNGNCTFKSKNDEVHFTPPDFKNEASDPLSHGKLTGGRSSVSCDKDQKNFISEKSSGIKDFGVINDSENKSTPGCDDLLDDKRDMRESIVRDRDVRDASKKLSSDIRTASEISGNGTSKALVPSSRSENYKGAHLSLIPNPHKEIAVDISLSDANGDTSKAPELNKIGEKQNGSTPSRHPNSFMHKARDHDGSSVRKDSRSQAAMNAMKEAKDLKRLADRFKNSGSADSTGMYFEAALKFLYGASLLETGSKENNKQNDIQCIDMYRSTAKFFEFCAHEYERSKDMVSASLAYKCMEVSYMRVMYTSHGNTNKDRKEVQMALKIVPPGESPASSASDVDNLNNPVIVDKVSTSKGMTSPQVAGNTGITARNRSSFTRLLEFAQDVSAAMDAAKKSRSTFAAANLRSGNANSGDAISSVKRALDFNFQDVEGLLRLIRIAKDAISG